MGLFSCKHKEYMVKECNKKDKFYTVRCLKCGEVWKIAKAEGEMYDTLQIIKRG